MTAKTTKDGTEDAPESSAAEVEAPEEAIAEEAAAKPAKRKRRVRVIEVIDDEDEETDLEEVLEALDAEDDEAPPVRTAKKKPVAATAVAAGAAKPSVKKPAAAKPVVVEEYVEDEDEDEAPKAGRKRAAASAGDEPPGGGPAKPTLLGMPRNAFIVVVVLAALLASLAIWQWRSASDLSATEQDRKDVVKVATDYGNIALNYNASNYQAQMEKAQKFMGGDLLENFKQCTLPNLGNSFKQNPKAGLTSKTAQVFVGSVDERFATATVSVDVGVQTAEGETKSPATLLRLSLSKSGSDWKVTQQFASGVNEQKRGCEQMPAPGASPSAETPKKEEKPKD